MLKILKCICSCSLLYNRWTIITDVCSETHVCKCHAHCHSRKKHHFTKKKICSDTVIWLWFKKKWQTN